MENQKNDNLNMLEAIVQNTEMGKNTLDQLVPRGVGLSAITSATLIFSY